MASPHLEYPLNRLTRARLLEQFPPRYSEVKADHVTIAMEKPEAMPRAQRVDIVGHADSGDGLEAMVVEVDGTRKRADGTFFHITWSLDPEKYRARDSGSLIARFETAGRIKYFDAPIALGPHKAIWIEDDRKGQKTAPAAP